MIKWFRESMRHELTHNDINISRRRIFSCTKNAPFENGIVAIFSIIVIVAIGTIGQEEIIEAQTDTTSMNPMIMHIHPQLSILVNGTSFSVPGQIGIDPSLWKDHSLDKYGMTGMAPIHTHDSSGVIHVESNTNRSYTLDDLLNIWGIDLSDKVVRISVNGKPINSLDYVLNDGDNIIMEIKQRENG
jgi:hypothetical protein